MCDVCLCTHIFVHYPKGIAYLIRTYRDPGREWGGCPSLTCSTTEAASFLIKTSGPEHSKFKVIFLKLSFRAWSDPSLPFTLLPDRVFLYRFIKLIPFLPGSWERSE